MPRIDDHSGYDGARFRERAARVRFARMERPLLERVAGRSCVLDLCCGTGRLTCRIRARRVIGLDLNPGMLAQARKRGLALVRADAHALPLLSETFDAVICTDSAFTQLELPRALSECARVLMRDGLLAVHYPTDAIWTPRHPLRPHSSASSSKHSGAELIRQARAHGFELASVELYRWLRFPPYLVKVRTPVHVRLWNHGMFVFCKR